MSELLNVRFVFYCRSTHLNNEGKSPIVMRIVFRGERRDIFSGLFCFKTDWSSSAQKVSKKEKSANNLNQNLTIIQQSAIQCFDELRFSRKDFTIDDLVNKIKGRESNPELLIDFLEEGNKKMKRKVGTEILEVTFLKYQRGVVYMKEFLDAEYKVKNFSLQKVDSDFLERYFQYLRNEKEIGHNTSCKYLQLLKTIFLPAIRNGVIKPDPFYGLKINPKPVYKEILSQGEIDKIASLEIEIPDLDRKRDIFLFACYTGLAYIDLQQLNSTHLMKDSEDE